MSGNTTPTTHKAKRRIHLCAWCSQAIDVGDMYKRYRFFDGSDAGTAFLHDECFSAMQEIAPREEYLFGDQERPKKVEANP